VADEQFKLLREEVGLLRQETREGLRGLREEMREAREVNRVMIASLEQQGGILREMQADIVAQREGFLALIDELRRHGLGGAPA
jgi:hypothetical protein